MYRGAKWAGWHGHDDGPGQPTVVGHGTACGTSMGTTRLCEQIFNDFRLSTQFIKKIIVQHNTSTIRHVARHGQQTMPMARSTEINRSSRSGTARLTPLCVCMHQRERESIAAFDTLHSAILMAPIRAG